MKLGNAIAQLRLELNDPATTANPQGKRYSDSLFTTWLNAGIALVYHFRKDLFMQTAVVQATEGDLQKPAGFDRILRVDGLSDKCGNLTTSLDQSNRGAMGLYPNRGCGDECPLPNTYSLHQNQPGVFEFFPPVPQNVEVFYRVTGSVAPKPFDCDLDEEFCTTTQVSIPAMEYARHMAYSTETESATSRAMSEQHFSIFLKLLGIFRESDKQYCKEFCKE